MKHQKLTVLSV